jgi:hypothetical protein
MTTPTYVYGLIASDTELPDGLEGLGPSGQVKKIAHGKVAAIVSDVPVDRPLGTREDLLAHEAVVDAVAASSTVLPMRFPAVVQEQGVVEELLEPHYDRFVQILDELEGSVQFTLKGRYVEESVLPEVVEGNDEIRTLQEKVRELPEDASYYDRVRLGELVVGALEEKRETDAQQMLEKLRPLARQTAVSQPEQPDVVINAAFLVERARQQEFEDAVEDVGKTFAGRLRLRLLGPLAPYDFVPQE